LFLLKQPHRNIGVSVKIDNTDNKGHVITYIVLFWSPEGYDDNNRQISTPFYAIYDDREVAESIARVRNAVLIKIEGKYKINNIVDYFRRDEKGHPIPFSVSIIKTNSLPFYKQISRRVNSK